MNRTEAILQSQSVWYNRYQGVDKKVLFVCSAGILRSATAARIYARKYNTRAVGTGSYALIPLTHDLLLWADEVVFVNEENYVEACQRFDLDSFRASTVVLNIPDDYDHMNPELISHFESQYEAL